MKRESSKHFWPKTIFTTLQNLPTAQNHQPNSLTCASPSPFEFLLSHKQSLSLSLIHFSSNSSSATSKTLFVDLRNRIESNMGPIVLTQLATGLSVLAGAALMDQRPMMGPIQCPRCNGTGPVACLCNRWSDGDAGCRTCAGSGCMSGSSCGGTGSGRPIPVQISVRRSNGPS